MIHLSSLIVVFGVIWTSAYGQQTLQQPISPQPQIQPIPRLDYQQSPRLDYQQSPRQDYQQSPRLDYQQNTQQQLQNNQQQQLLNRDYSRMNNSRNDLNIQSGGNSNRFSNFYNPQRQNQFQFSNNFIDMDNLDENLYCPEYWLAYKQRCYRFIKSPKRNWFEAKKICQAYQADLINIDSIDKHSFILRKLIVDNNKALRYFISAKQTTPFQWVNDDNTQLVQTDFDSISTDEVNDIDRENDFYSLKHMNPSSDTLIYGQQSPQQQQSQQQDYYNRNYNSNINPRFKDRIVYGFSPKKGRWLFIPTYDFENNLFICESTALYNIINLNLLIEKQSRTKDYGIDHIGTDETKLPRGPYFIKQPQDTTYDTGQQKIRPDVSISCLAGGYPTPTYRWYKEEYVNDNLTFTEIDPFKDSRFTISGGNLIINYPTQNLDQGLYHCLAENKFGRIISESVKLNFGFILEFNLKRSAEQGESNWGKAVFCDPPQNYPGVKYYWSRDFFPNFVEEDQRVFVSYDGALYFTALESIDRANYSCTVQSLVSGTGRNGPFFPLRVKPHPNYQALLFANSFPKVFPEAPIANEEIRLECVAFGYPVPTYNWTRVNGDLPRHSYQIKYNRVLIIPNATINDNGDYLCTVRNDRKTLEKQIQLNIQMKPNFTIPLRDQFKDFNSDVSFICEANAVPDVNYTWYKNGEFMDRERLDKDKYLIQDNVLTIKYLDEAKDDGMYQCKAENQLKAVYSSAQLRVLKIKPTFKKKPLEPEIYAIYNGNTTIACDPEAAPRPTFQWKKDGNLIGSGGHRKILPGTGTLIISPTSRDDEGIYTCVASNSYGTDESKSRLIVLQELRFTQILPPRTLSQIDELLYLQCDVIHDEILDVAFIWTHNGQIILDNTSPRYRISYNTLEIQNVTLLDSGDYECIAKSAVNRIVTKTQVIVQGPPGAPGGVKVIDIRKRMAVLEWIDGAPNGRPIMYYNILGRTNWNKTWVNVSEGVQAQEVDRYTGRKRAEVHNLTPWSGYEFSIAAVNDLGIGTQSAPSPLYSTHHDKPYISPRNIGGGGGKIGDLTIMWEPLLPQEQNSIGIYYKIFWQQHGKSSGASEWASEILKTQGNVGQAVVSIPQDHYYTKYNVKVQAWNDLGEGPISNSTTIYSAEDMPQVAPQQTEARSFNSTALNVSWVPVEETREKIRGKLIGHRVSIIK